MYFLNQLKVLDRIEKEEMLVAAVLSFSQNAFICFLMVLRWDHPNASSATWDKISY